MKPVDKKAAATADGCVIFVASVKVPTATLRYHVMYDWTWREAVADSPTSEIQGIQSLSELI